MTPSAVADALLLGLLRSDAEAFHIAKSQGPKHTVTFDFERGAMTCLELPSALGDAVIARLALVGTLDFTASDERFGILHVDDARGTHRVTLSVRSQAGHLAAYVRRMEPQAEQATHRRGRQASERLDHIGDYVLLEEIGRGGAGTVFRAEHRLLKKQAAIKLWNLPNTAMEGNAALLREARAANAMRHPGIVDVYDLLRLPDGRVAMVMELLQGETLAKHIQRAGALHPVEALRLARAIAEIFQATHAAGIVHRDLKPDNVFVLSDARIKVLDFGAASNVLVPEEASNTLGTPSYMAPEQALGQRPDRRSDIYSLGCVLFEMLTGNCPYQDRDPRAVMIQHIQAPIPTPVSPFGPLPEVLERSVLRALAKEPERRHQSIVELSQELELADAALSRHGWRKWLAR